MTLLLTVTAIVACPTPAAYACDGSSATQGSIGNADVSCPGEGDEEPDVDQAANDQDSGDASNNSDEPRVCTLNDEVIDCEAYGGIWNGRCYAALADPQPDSDDPVWEGNTDGVIITCTPALCVYEPANYCPAQYDYWAASAPGADGPSERELADRAVAAMQLQMGQIGSTPPSTAGDPDSKGLIGVPTWL